MRRAVVTLLISATISLTGATAYSAEEETCWVYDELLSGGDCTDYYQSQADAAWEGLSMEQQQEIMLSGLEGEQLDKHVIRVRDGLIMEDEPGWDCHIHGNKICGPIVITELPRTN